MCGEQNAVYVNLILINGSWSGEKYIYIYIYIYIYWCLDLDCVSEDLGSMFKVQSSQTLGIHDIWWHEFYTVKCQELTLVFQYVCVK